MATITSVRVQRRATTAREYDAITIVVGDLKLSCDVTCSRDIKLAKRLADDAGCFYYCAPEVWERFPGGELLA